VLFRSRTLSKMEASFNFEKKPSLNIEEEREDSGQSISMPTHVEVFSFGKNAPPFYQKSKKSNKDTPPTNSFFRTIEYTRDTTQESYRILKKLAAIFFCSITITVILLFLMAVPIVMIVVGALFLKMCTFQKMIPIWLIVFGSLSVIKNLSTLFQRIKALKRNENNSSSTVLNVFDSFMALFLIIWFLCGNYWVYTNTNNVQFVDPLVEATYCDKTTYLLAFWVITSIYILLGAGCMLFCFTVCCTIFIPTKE